MEGKRFGPYRVLAPLGSGGMGEVFCAETVGLVPGLVRGLEPGATVALKVIHAHLLETEGFFKRFLREAQIGQQVEHENVVRTYDCDATLVDGKQQNFLVMEYVEGQTLRDLLVELERVPEELCRHIGREVANGLAAIHDAGVVHRDLKPENVLITPDHVVKVMDLGVARLTDETIRLSRAGSFVGSLEYAAPEQFQTAESEPDGRADLYGLGVVLYELATGQHPYRDEDASRLLRNILDAEPRRAGEVNPQLSPFFEELVHTLLAKDPGQRFPNAVDLAGVLDEGEHADWWQQRAQALRLETKRPLRRIRIPRETALYGREDELAKLQALYDKAKSGDGQVLLLEGEAGIGKTRLVDEFVGRLLQEGEDVNFLFGFYPPGGAATASGAFSTAYREHFGEEGLEETLGEYLKRTPILTPAFAALLRGETAPSGAQGLDKDSLQTVFVHATRGLAAERTTIVLIDDLHFAPGDGRALFTSLAMSVPDHRILLIGTMRRGVSEEWFAGITRHDHAESSVLSRLGPKDLGALLREAFRSECLADELGWKISEKSDGNPFFAFEIIRELRERQLISREADGTWLTTGAIEEIEVPSSIVDLIHARLEALSEQERELLDVAACFGVEFPVSLVADAVDMSRIPALRAFARIEKAHHLVRSHGRVFAFDHHQVHEVLYRGQPVELREAYHAALAEALERREGALEREPDDLDGALCADLCTHFLHGARGEQALRYLDAALTHLESGFLSEQAIALADRALEQPDVLRGRRRLDILLRKCGRLDLLGRLQQQESLLKEAEVLAADLGDKASAAAVAQAAGNRLWNLGRFEEAKVHHERSLEIARELGDRDSELEATRSLGITFYRLARYDEARTHLERCLEVAKELGNADAEAGATVNLANCLYSLGRHVEARESYERGLEQARTCGNQKWEGAALGNLGNVVGALGQNESAIRYQEQYIALARKIGYRQGEATGRLSLGNALHDLARYEEATHHREQSLTIAREIGDRNLEAIALVNLGPGWFNFGRLPEAREALEASLAICRAIGARYPEGFALWSLSQVEEEDGDLVAAIARAKEALALRREIGHERGVADCLLRLGGCQRRAGEFAAARQTLEESVRLYREQAQPSSEVAALASLAALPGMDSRAALAALEEMGEEEITAETNWLLWRATGDLAHLQMAKQRLDEHQARVPEEHHESILKNLRLHRDILTAWAEHGGDA